jgi:SnoaL-like domain
MRPAERDRQIVEAYLRTMQMGPRGEDGLVELFTEDGEYVESLTVGRRRTHRGKQAIREALHDGLSWNPPDFRVSLDRLEVEATELVAYWTCTSETLPHPMSGVDRYTLRDGLIARLETRLTTPHVSDPKD